MNIFRDPRWGRGQETPGEDPFLTGTYSAIYVRGLQATDRRGGGLRISACCKHLAAYSLEDSDGVTRYEFDAEVTTQDLADTYLPAFRSCVIRGGASCVMCAYNAVNGVPMCANKPFLTGLVREKWAFDGYVTSDCDAVKNGARRLPDFAPFVFTLRWALLDTAPPGYGWSGLQSSSPLPLALPSAPTPQSSTRTTTRRRCPRRSAR